MADNKPPGQGRHREDRAEHQRKMFEEEELKKWKRGGGANMNSEKAGEIDPFSSGSSAASYPDQGPGHKGAGSSKPARGSQQAASSGTHTIHPVQRDPAKSSGGRAPSDPSHARPKASGSGTHQNPQRSKTAPPAAHGTTTKQGKSSASKKH